MVYDFAYSNGPKSVAWSSSLVPVQDAAFTLRPVPTNQTVAAPSPNNNDSQSSYLLNIRTGVVTNVYV